MQSHLCVSFLRSRLHNGTLISLSDCNAVASDFTFPEDAAWNAERWAVEFGVEIGEYCGVVRGSSSASSRNAPSPTVR